MSNSIQEILNPIKSNLKIKVLLVDDQMIVGETVKRMFADESDIELHFCQQPAEAIKTAQDIEPTVILQDLVMPDIDGLTLVKFYRASAKLKDIPIIVLSSKEEATTKAESFSVGANDYLVKLPDKIELIARIRYHSQGYINLLERNLAYESLEKSQNALARELAKAGEYVVSLLPPPIKNNEVDTFWRFIPSAQLGGDAFGYHWLDSDNFAMYLLDVCGHGVGSALMSVSALNVLRGESLAGADYKDPASLLAALNRSYQMSDHNGLYFTIWYGVFNKQSKTLKYASGGHPPAFVKLPNGENLQLANDNFIIGGLPEFPYTSSEVQLELPAEIFIYSDGVYEIEKPDGIIWELDEMFDFVIKNPGKDYFEIDNLLAYIKELSGKDILDDDYSMMKIVLK
ncbi:MAG: fused response regulator/phosphatase [Candidatus Kapabacteria bacterium]|nr:fused response regulator/phosphatase [Ignavibacteriota bacterium]MCW5886027.1 fused response regulator/phosphatase [Candidatus Kapabacteria bacterium]